MPVVSTGEITIIDVMDGLPGQAVLIQPSAQGFTYQDGVATPASQSIAYYATKQGIDGAVTWSASDGMTLDTDNGALGHQLLAFGVPNCGIGDVAYLDLSDFGSLRQAMVSATVESLTDFQSVLRLDKSTAQGGATRNVFVGDWASGTSYFVGDVVLKDGYGWSCVQDHVSSGSILPPAYPTTSNAYWTLYAVKGDAGVPGVRGTITTAKATAGTTWSDSEATTAISDAGGGTPIQGDVVTLYKSSSGYSETRVRSSGGTWTALLAFFGGDVLVDGTLGASKIAAGAITTDKLLVTGRGPALNDDPNTQDASAWAGGTFAITTDTTSPTGRALSITSTGATTWSAKSFPLDATKNYNLRMKAKQVSGTTPAYLLVAFYNASGAVLSGTGNPTGWPSAGSYHYFGRINETIPTSWTDYQISFGPDETAKIPAGAVSAKVGFLANYTGTGEQRFTAIRLMEKAAADLIVDGAITATKLSANSIAVGTAAIQNGAIVNAMLGDATITSAKIADANITTAKIADLTVTTAKIANFAITNAKIGGYIASDNFDGTIDASNLVTSVGTTGWAIGKGGNAVLNSAVVRGTVYATDGSFTGTINANSGYFAGTVAAGSVDVASLSGQATTYGAAGTYSITVPTGMTQLRVTLIGGGGGGGGNNTSDTSVGTQGSSGGWTTGGARRGGGGGGGGKFYGTFTVTPGTTLTLVVGTGGSGGGSQQNGSAGGNTQITGTGISGAVAYGGAGGAWASTGSNTGGAGGAGTTSGNAGNTGTSCAYANDDTLNGWYIPSPGSSGGGGNSATNFGTGGSGAYPNPAGQNSMIASTAGTPYGGGGGGGCTSYVTNGTGAQIYGTLRGHAAASAGGNGYAIIELSNPTGIVVRSEWNQLIAAINAHGIYL